jgi:hypothetical protein
VLFWVGGELFGIVIGGVAEAGAGSYVLGLVCAGIGAGIAYAIVNSLGQSELASFAAGGDDANPHYDPSNPYSPPRGGAPPPGP